MEIILRFKTKFGSSSLDAETEDFLESAISLELDKEGAELKQLRGYCLLTFGESHPEIKKCPHELKADSLRAALEKYGRHTKACNESSCQGELCSCGLDALSGGKEGAE